MAKTDLKQKEHSGLSGANSGKQKNLIPIDLAVERALRLAKPLPQTQVIALEKSNARVLAQSIISRFDQPPFDNSAMDGYGIRLSELKGEAPWVLDICATIVAGEEINDLPEKGALRIFTGALVPSEIDAVIMQEHVSLQDNKITIHQLPKKGANIRRKGEDISSSQTLLEAGELMTPARMALVASCGLYEIKVQRKVKVAFFSTGSELRQPDEQLAPAQIYNSNRFLLAGLLNQPMVDLIDLGSVPDDADKLAKTLKQASEIADIVISSGGILIDQQENYHGLQKELKADLQVLKLAMRPAKPMLIGKINNCVYIGLPGNPMAAHVTFNMIAKPIIEKHAGLKMSKQLSICAISSFDKARRPFRHEYLPVIITGKSDDGALLLQMLGKGGSAEILPMANADGLAVIEPGDGYVSAGDRVQFIPL